MKFKKAFDMEKKCGCYQEAESVAVHEEWYEESDQYGAGARLGCGRTKFQAHAPLKD